MDGRGGCCIASYDGGTYDTSKIDRIMLKFRPIAPKPAVSGSVSRETSPEKTNVKTTRTKRRYVKDNNTRYCRKKKKVVPRESKENTVVTLSLLPEQPDPKESPNRASPSSSSSSDQLFDLTVAPKTPVQQYLPSIWLKSGGIIRSSDQMVVIPHPVRPVGSCVVVGNVTETFMEGEELLLGLGLGRTDEEKINNLEVDTCPGFISDGLNMVRWTNEAYKRLVNNQDGSSEMVWLVMNDNKEEGLSPLIMNKCTAFACRVRLQYTCRKEKNSLIVPCDVWKMDGGGFAWRLDVKAALSLGR